MDLGMVVSLAGVGVAGLAGVLGVWMEREPDSTKIWAAMFSVIIAFSMGVEFVHTVVVEVAEQGREETMARLLEKLSDLSEKGDNPALASFVGAELAAQARSNPGVVKKLEKKIAAKGGDPSAVRKRAAAGRRTSAGLPAKKAASTSSASTGKKGAKKSSGKGGGKGGGGKGGGDKASQTSSGKDKGGSSGKGKKKSGGKDGKDDKDKKSNKKSGK